MENDKILELIEQGLIDYYINEDYKLDQDSLVSEPSGDYPNIDKYKKLAKQILFKAKAASRKSRIAKVISIAEVRGKLKALDNQYEGKVFTMFKKHIEEYGLAANYRNFDSISEKEMLSILQQLDMTALFDEIENELDDE